MQIFPRQCLLSSKILLCSFPTAISFNGPCMSVIDVNMICTSMFDHLCRCMTANSCSSFVLSVSFAHIYSQDNPSKILLALNSIPLLLLVDIRKASLQHHRATMNTCTKVKYVSKSKKGIKYHYHPTVSILQWRINSEKFIVGLPCARMAPHGVLSGKDEWRGETIVRTQKRPSNVH